MGRLFLTGVVFVAGLGFGQARAAEAQFALINNTSRDITHVYVSSPGNGDWSYDLLAVSRLAPGEKTHITVPDLHGCRVDIRVRYGDENLGYRSGVDVCQSGIVGMGK
jgi:hypothetical protein